MKKPILFFALIIILAVNLILISTPRDRDYYKKLGYFELRPYKYGLYLTQRNSDLFYNFSPYDFYYGNNPSDKVIKIQNKVAANEFGDRNQFLENLNSTYNGMLSYFNILSPTVSFLRVMTKYLYIRKPTRI